MNPSFEYIIYPENSSLMACHYETEQVLFEWHHHPEVELTWVGNGSGQRYVGDHVEGFGASDLVLLGSNLPHSWSGAPKMKKTPIEAIVLQFLPDRIFNRNPIPEFKPLNVLFSQAARGLCFGEPTQAMIYPLLSQIHQAEGLERLGLLLEILRILCEASDVSGLASDRFLEVRAAKSDPRMERVMALMNERFSETISLNDLAQTVAMSRSAFCRYFQRRTGSTPIAHLVTIRLSQACSLLRDTDRSVTEICYASGFENLSNFNRHFKHRNGMPPSAYRRQWQT